MLEKEKRLFCINCDEEELCELHIESHKHNINGEELEIEENRYYCSNCHNEVYDSESSDLLINTVNNIIRINNGLITKEEI